MKKKKTKSKSFEEYFVEFLHIEQQVAFYSGLDEGLKLASNANADALFDKQQSAKLALNEWAQAHDDFLESIGLPKDAYRSHVVYK